ncbi:MAG: hypothetical protein JST79_11890 [Acidobacteria bacterium]|nr:hypothetical protein [Acidobacteriota bacterium]
MTITELTRTLNNLGQVSQTSTTPDGSRLLIVPDGGRVLGLFSADSDQNFYWTNPAVFAAKAGTVLNKEGWRNLGGDRTWLAPEIELSFPRSPDLSTYRVPPEIDPGNYEVVQSGSSLHVLCRAKVKLFRSHQSIDCEITKTWQGASNPLRYEKVWDQMAGVQFAGYTQSTLLRLAEPEKDSGPIGVWNLIQMPHTGTAFFPLHGASEPTVYFGTIPPDDLIVKNHMVGYRMSAEGIQKIGIRAAASTGRAGYLYRDGALQVLLVRNVFLDPSAEYVDVPWDSSGQLGSRGYSFQACNLNHKEIGTFSELEYHAPAVGSGTGRWKHQDVSQVWAFRGPMESIREIGQTLIAPDFPIL